jgi:hypothetical protein
MHNNVGNYDDYVIWILGNVQCIFNSKNNEMY